MKALKTTSQRRDEAILKCREILTNPDKWAVLDTETSGLNGEVVEIAIADPRGEELLNTRVMPKGDIEPGAQNIHGIPSLSSGRTTRLFGKTFGIRLGVCLKVGGLPSTTRHSTKRS